MFFSQHLYIIINEIKACNLYKKISNSVFILFQSIYKKNEIIYNIYTYLKFINTLNL
jgi:hypothetical protein